MLKKLCLMLILSVAPLTASDIAVAEIRTTLSHITREKKVIRKLAIKTMQIGTAAKKMLKAKTNSQDYSNLKNLIKESLNRIIHSPEFIKSLIFVTDYQAECIVDKLMAFNDIEYNSLDYPLDIEQKIQEELPTIFTEVNEQTNQVFNMFYVPLAGLYGCHMLLEKLTTKEQKLNIELESLQNQ